MTSADIVRGSLEEDEHRVRGERSVRVVRWSFNFITAENGTLSSDPAAGCGASMSFAFSAALLGFSGFPSQGRPRLPSGVTPDGELALNEMKGES